MDGVLGRVGWDKGFFFPGTSSVLREEDFVLSSASKLALRSALIPETFSRQNLNAARSWMTFRETYGSKAGIFPIPLCEKV